MNMTTFFWLVVAIFVGTSLSGWLQRLPCKKWIKSIGDMFDDEDDNNVPV